jgi:hypothetical protein
MMMAIGSLFSFVGLTGVMSSDERSFRWGFCIALLATGVVFLVRGGAIYE